MKFCPVVPEICRGQVHGARKERRRIIIIIRNGAKTISLQTLFGRLNEKRSKNNKSPKQRCLGDLIIRNGAKTISLQKLFGRLKYLNAWAYRWLVKFNPNKTDMAKKKNMCVYCHMSKKSRVGRSGLIFFFFFLLSTKPEIVIPDSGNRFRYLIFENSGKMTNYAVFLPSLLSISTKS